MGRGWKEAFNPGSITGGITDGATDDTTANTIGRTINGRKAAPAPTAATGLYFLTAGGVAGALLYFLWPGPPWALFLCLTIALGLSFISLSRGKMSAISWLWGLIGAGLVAASALWQVQGLRDLAPVMRGDFAGIAQVVAQEPRGETYRSILEIPGPAGQRVAVRLTHEAPLVLGGWYQSAFWAAPVSGPLYPGGFDPRFKFIFEGLRGFGRLEQANLVQEPSSQSALSRHSINRLRLEIDQRLRAQLPDQRGAVASAMLTGMRGGISLETLELFRTSGLAHLLAISGLHLSLVASLVFFLVRLVFWLRPHWALRVNQTQVASLAALCAALGYFTLSGGAVPTQRALVLALVAGLALLLGRRAIIWRLWAFALFAIVLFGPHLVFAVSTHLSFLAVAILIRVSQHLHDWAKAREARTMLPVHPVFRWTLGLLAATFAVNIVTIPLLMLVFGQAPTLGVVANMFAVPFAGVALIPLAFLSLLAMPLVLEAWPLHWLGQCLSLLFDIASWIAQTPHATLTLRQSPLPLVYPLLLAYALLLCPQAVEPSPGPARLHRPWRRHWVGAGLLCLCLTLPILAPEPEALHHPEGWVLAKDEQGRLSSVGQRDISAYAVSQVRGLWTQFPAPLPRASVPVATRAGAETGAILIYHVFGRSLSLPARWLQNEAAWLPDERRPD